MDLQAHGSEPGQRDLSAEEPGGRSRLQTEAAAHGGQPGRQEDAPPPASGSHCPTVGERTQRLLLNEYHNIFL